MLAIAGTILNVHLNPAKSAHLRMVWTPSTARHTVDKEAYVLQDNPLEPKLYSTDPSGTVLGIPIVPHNTTVPLAKHLRRIASRFGVY